VDPELQAMAQDELSRACSLKWRELSKVTPWGDTYDGFAPSGRAVQVERNYVWAGEPGGAILAEVTVFQNAVLYDAGGRASQVIPRS
jgi:hypothetical protein